MRNAVPLKDGVYVGVNHNITTQAGEYGDEKRIYTY